MGIRFFCPNGHKLNVKEFQAGMRGICPYCGAKFHIPTQSTRPSSKQKRREQQIHGGGGGTATLSPRATSLGADSPDVSAVAGPQVPLEAAAGGAVVSAPTPLEPAAPLAMPEAVADEAASGAAESAVAYAADPIVEAGDVVWYVRPPSGGQFGPATGDILRCWLAEGRVSGDTLVWREGWRDWQEARAIFPELRPGGSAASTPADFSAPALSSTPVSAAAKGKTARNNQMLLLTGLVVFIVLLIVIFLWILNSGS